MAGTREYEDLNKNLEMVDGHAVKAPEDYQDPEELYQALIARDENHRSFWCWWRMAHING